MSDIEITNFPIGSTGLLLTSVQSLGVAVNSFFHPLRKRSSTDLKFQMFLFLYAIYQCFYLVVNCSIWTSVIFLAL